MSITVRAESTAQDFDFWMGTWKAHNRRLKRQLAGSEDWEEFEATSIARPLFGGLANEDEFHTDFDGGYQGMSFRFFDPETKQWSIYWATAAGSACSTRR